jgi:hypothetical protein
LSGIDQSIEKYGLPLTEQGAQAPSVRPPGQISDDPRVWAFAVALKAAEATTGALVIVGGQATLPERVQHILKHARAAGLDPRLYHLAWWCDRQTKSRQLSLSNEVTP